LNSFVVNCFVIQLLCRFLWTANDHRCSGQAFPTIERLRSFTHQLLFCLSNKLTLYAGILDARIPYILSSRSAAVVTCIIRGGLLE